jgi:cytochrome c oxidase subunit 2
MAGQVIAMTPESYAAWLEAQGASHSLAAQGGALFRALGCSGCHSPGANVHAPSLEGVWGRPVPLSNGQVVMADRRYIRDSILEPEKDVAAGYRPIMPSFRGRVSEDDIIKLLAYIESLARKRPDVQ